LIYDRSETYDWLKDFPKERIINTKNIGNADYDRLGYLIDNYDNLPKVFLWSKSNLFKYIREEEFDLLKDNKTFTPLLTQHHKVYEPVCRYVDGIYEELNNSWYASQFGRKFNTYNDWAEYMGLPTPRYLRFVPGGNYILTPKEVYKWPKEFYIKMRNTLEHAILPAEAQYAERSYYTLWR
ncbi:MAG: hypothetical protein AABY22_34320, partial [Nanoarchaeota archaeon]